MHRTAIDAASTSEAGLQEVGGPDDRVDLAHNAGLRRAGAPRTTRRVWRRVGSATSKRASEPWFEPLQDAYACIVVPLASRLAIRTQIVPGVECWSHPYSLRFFDSALQEFTTEEPKTQPHVVAAVEFVAEETVESPRDATVPAGNDIQVDLAQGGSLAETIERANEVTRPSKTWGWSRRFPKRTAAPSLCGGMIAIECAVDDGGANLQHQMSTSR